MTNFTLRVSTALEEEMQRAGWTQEDREAAMASPLWQLREGTSEVGQREKNG